MVELDDDDATVERKRARGWVFLCCAAKHQEVRKMKI
jgi:hypothetical protein